MLNKIAIIGLGTMGVSFARYALPLCDRVLVYDNDEEKMDKLDVRMDDHVNPFDQHPEEVDIEAHRGKIETYSNLQDLLNETPDLVVKPIACDLEEACRMYETAKENQRFLFVEFCLHRYAEFEYLSKLITAMNPVYPVRYQ